MSSCLYVVYKCEIMTVDLNPFRWVQVSLASDPKVVAGKIAHCSRSNRPPTVLAIGQGCLNQAIKVSCVATCSLALTTTVCHISHCACALQSVAIARRFCMQPQTSSDVAFDLSCQPAFRDNSQPTARCMLNSLSKHFILHTICHKEFRPDASEQRI